MNSGHIIKKIKKEIQSITAELHDIYGVYGFGSFFRSDRYNDIDILIVASPVCEDTLSLFYLAKERLQEIDQSIDIDITLLTYSEFLTKPLLEMDSLTEIYTVSKDVLLSVPDD
jgi:predicted nucleotidyltransferase